MQNKIFDIETKSQFETSALEIFDYQMKNNPVYSSYAKLLLKEKTPVNIYEIPFLPISFFKTNQIICQGKAVEEMFLSSGTKGEQSKHLVAELDIYSKSYLKTFQQFYGDIKNYCILALLPNYQEREGSSLIYMVDDLIQ
ncbi:MAG: acyl transferase, partial [Bacteroidota bacterium]|nr:acyl transferase [Bacteroidota bacterium]